MAGSERANLGSSGIFVVPREEPVPNAFSPPGGEQPLRPVSRPRLRRGPLFGAFLLLAAAAMGVMWPVIATSSVDVAIRRHDWAAATAALDGLERRDPGRPDVAFRRGRILRRQDHLLEAARAFDVAARLGHDTEQIHRQRVLMKAQVGRVTADDPEIRHLLGAAVDDEFAEECYEALIKGHLAGHRIDEARQCVAFWTEWQPDNALAHAAAGLVAEKLERHGEAIDAYRRALTLDPHDLSLRSRVAALEVHAGRLDVAAAEYSGCLERRPDDPRLLLGLADCQFRRGRPQEASGLVYDALALDLTAEETAVALAALAGLAAEERRSDTACVLYADAIRLDPRNIPARFGYAATLNARGRGGEATHQLAEAQKLSDAHRRLTALTRQTVGEPANADLRVEIARILADLGLREEGARWLEAALQIDPGHARARLELDAHDSGSPADDDGISRPIGTITKEDT